MSTQIPATEACKNSHRGRGARSRRKRKRIGYRILEAFLLKADVKEPSEGACAGPNKPDLPETDVERGREEELVSEGGESTLEAAEPSLDWGGFWQAGHDALAHFSKNRIVVHQSRWDEWASILTSNWVSLKMMNEATQFKWMEINAIAFVRHYEEKESVKSSFPVYRGDSKRSNVGPPQHGDYYSGKKLHRWQPECYWSRPEGGDVCNCDAWI
jgi:hypothetical protein